MEIMSRIDLLLVKKDMLKYVNDVTTMSGMELSISDHSIVYIV